MPKRIAVVIEKRPQAVANTSIQTGPVRPERARIHAELRGTARLGFVPDGQIWRLHADYCEELAEDKRLLDALEQEMETHLRRLDTLFPVPVPPAPEPPKPPRPRHFGRIGGMWGQDDAETRH